MQPNEVTEVLSRPLSQELLARDMTRMAYVAKDGTPRNIPIVFTWNGRSRHVHAEERAETPCPAPEPGRRADDRHRGAPARDLAHPGRAELDYVDGIPDEYLQMNGTYEMTAEQRVEWEAEVRSLYHEGMVRIVVTPTWAKLIDFESTLPSAVEELIQQRAERQGA